MRGKNTSLKIDFKNCYGIGSLQKDFEFSEKQKTFSIYASNGSMKTSFAKTFEAISQGEKPEDSVFTDRKTSCKIKLNGSNIDPSKIFVIHSYDKDYGSEKLSTLMVKRDLREKYEKVNEGINEKKNVFLKEIKNISGVQVGKIEQIISEVFYNNETNKFFESLERIRKEINNDEIASYKGIKYKNIFDERIIELLEEANVKNDIQKYIEKYDELLDKSTYFKNGIFNHSQAEEIAKNLEKNNFFRAEHAVLLSGKKIESVEELSQVINNEKEKILTDVTLKTVFDALDEKISATVGLRSFRNFLADNQFIISEFKNLKSFEAKLWKYYIKEKQILFNELLDEYLDGKSEIESISEQARQEKTEWKKTIDLFNERFEVPFKVVVGNEVEVMLENEAPYIAFEYEDREEKMDMERDYLLEVLSQGEKRALYLLDTIFEVEARKVEGGAHLFIIDDIADSFDYKNKYAIIEYLRDMSKTNDFYQIILSHNFDFHRTISSRLTIKSSKTLNALKSKDAKVELRKEPLHDNPFSKWRDDLSNEHSLIALIPFVRNLANYAGDLKSEPTLISFMHMKKSKTEKLTLAKLKKPFKKIINVNIDKIPSEANYLKFLQQAADSIPNLKSRELKHKIVLAIAIRLCAEKFMINEISKYNKINKINNDWLKDITSNQTAKLLDMYKEKFPEEIDNIKTLDKVQLMTPESIHLNSFMFEPLLDMSDEYLIELFKKIKELK